MRVSTSVVLVSSFVALLLVIAGAAFEVWRNARSAQEHVAALHRAHLEAGGALAGIRASVYLTGILTRDYLLDSEPGHEEQYIRQFEDIRSKTEQSFKTLEALGGDDQKVT